MKITALQKLIDRHEFLVEMFQNEATKFFHPHAVMLCRRIKKGIPEFTGCMLAMRQLFLEPKETLIDGTNYNGENVKIPLKEIYRFLNIQRGTVDLPQDTIDALMELDKLSDYIDNNLNFAGTLFVDLSKK